MLSNKLIPTLDAGRFFISPILGCTGGCSYCYLEINNYRLPRKNEVSIDELRNEALSTPGFIWGKDGTILSVGAWGDIFPPNNEELTDYSVQVICDLLDWGNPVQIMSKNTLSNENIKKIISHVQFQNQLLYSSTITTLLHWQEIEPAVSSPVDRLKTCLEFKQFGIPTNILLKPFMLGISDNEFEEIIDLLLKFKVDYCTLGVMYIDEKIQRRMERNLFLRENLIQEPVYQNHLDCHKDIPIESTNIETLKPFLHYAKDRGISIYLKSSCVNANLLKVKNPSNYYGSNSPYCIKCGCCSKIPNQC